MVKRLARDPVVAREAVGRVARVGEDPLRFAERVAVQADQIVAEPDIAFGVFELAVRRAGEVVNGAVLVKQPRDLVRVADEVRREFRRDHGVDPLVVRLGEIDEAPRGRLREQLRFRVPLERDRDALGTIPAARQLGDQAAHVQLRATVRERHLRFTDQNGADR